ncbi:hypothetical protein SEA_HORUS_76 [Gordonia phage Horus]|uniref:Uncharacterized protein n=2 Tax=Langleyhallvirinae TaxID=2732613 RepID=A0A385E1J7_9CAUD|nr:hypothetical protein HOT93_gp074 [Gordonia phage Horus]YP_009808414.1 hypothetical protein HOT94_gp073 [Gordonia phage Phistory]AXQ63928.1 hypothetical protein SEA_HORUS_76 [Gordonia phage Horus]AXQ64778.1 hypothetical protein SEA_PHISTORY_73 [Gordonia phage Phistory]WNM69781.1 hypothetical protein SEA_CRATER_74 [Gordonia phage Crater]
MPKSYDQLDDLRGTKAVRVVSASGRTTAQFCVDRRWYDQNDRVVPLDAHGPWTILSTHVDGM